MNVLDTPKRYIGVEEKSPMDQFRRPLTNTAEEFFSCAYDVLSHDMSSQTLVRLAVELAAVSNRFAHLSGIEKAQFVQNLFLDVLARIEKELPECQTEMTEQLRQARVFVQDLLPQLLNVAVDVAKGRIQFEKALSTGVSCVGLLLSCFSRKAKPSAVATPEPAREPVKEPLKESEEEPVKESEYTSVIVVESCETEAEKVFEPREPAVQVQQTYELGTAEIPVPTYEVRLATFAPPATLPPLPESRSETPSAETPQEIAQQTDK